MNALSFELFDKLSWYDNGDGLQCYTINANSIISYLFMFQAPEFYTARPETNYIRRWDVRAKTIKYRYKDGNNYQDGINYHKPRWCQNERLDDLRPIVRLDFDKLSNHGIDARPWERDLYDVDVRL
jgi:hypothetical protein